MSDSGKPPRDGWRDVKHMPINIKHLQATSTVAHGLALLD
jgi:hypothetical protein